LSQKPREEFSFPSFLDVTRISWKQMLVPPIAFLAIVLAVFAVNYSNTGEFVKFGIDFTGGVLISFPNSYELDPEVIESELREEFGLAELTARKGSGVLSVETQSMEDDILSYMADRYAKTGATTKLDIPLAETFRQQAPVVLIAAFVGMGVVVYVVFRSPIPSMAVLGAALLDILGAMGLMTIFGVRLSLATVAALLMLIGYSVDTNILLTSRLLKRREEMRVRLLGAMKTGLTMSVTTIFALGALYVFSTSDVLDDIALVLLFGLVADLLNTWLFNAGLLRGYLTRKFMLLERRGRRR
jgi:preprotein translocase subunit SecF